jgi:hypothetical protein
MTGYVEPAAARHVAAAYTATHSSRDRLVAAA